MSGRICSEEGGAGAETSRAAPAKFTLLLAPAGVEGREGVDEREGADEREGEEPLFRLCSASLCPASCDLLSA